MPGIIEEANALLEYILPIEFDRGRKIAIIPTYPQLILQGDNYNVKLWATSLSGGPKTVNMMMPSLGRALKRLADLGHGRSEFVDDMRYMFIERKLVSPLKIHRRSIHQRGADG